MEIGAQVASSGTDHVTDSTHALRRALSRKTTLFLIIVALVGTIIMLADAVYFPASSTSPGRGVLLALGATLVTSSTISIVSEMFLRSEIIRIVADKVVSILPIERHFRLAGLDQFGENREELDFSKIWRSASGYLYVIGLSANDILSPQYMPQAIKRLTSEREFSVRVLLINPWSTSAGVRASAPCYDSQAEFLRRVWAILQEMRDTSRALQARGSGAQLEVRLYDQVPSLSMIIDDKHAVVTPIGVSRQGGISPFFVFRNNVAERGAYSVYRRHFDAVWDDALALRDGFTSIFAQSRSASLAFVQNMPSTLEEWIARVSMTDQPDGDQGTGGGTGATPS